LLLTLLRTHLRPYRGLLVIVVILQTGQAVCNLYLPNLNAKIIDNGVLTGDTAYIWATGALMIGVTLAQVALSIGSVATCATTCSTGSPRSPSRR
jgi:ATP-binding cassette subfamily B multidrug efflux pump